MPMALVSCGVPGRVQAISRTPSSLSRSMLRRSSCRFFVVALRGRAHADSSYLLRCDGREHLHDARDDAGPARLMARAEPCAVVAVEVLVELDVVTPQRVRLKLLGPAIQRPPAVSIA